MRGRPRRCPAIPPRRPLRTLTRPAATPPLPPRDRAAPPRATAARLRPLEPRGKAGRIGTLSQGQPRPAAMWDPTTPLTAPGIWALWLLIGLLLMVALLRAPLLPVRLRARLRGGRIL